MRCLVLIVLMLLLAAPGVAQGDSVPKQLKKYAPDISYPGGFEAERLFRLRQSAGYILRKNNPSALEDVFCSDARDALQFHGQWYGNLHEDGSCASPGDPEHWVTGNYLNFRVLADSLADRSSSGR